MRRLSSLILSALLLAAAVSPASAAGQFGKPRYLVKAFLLKADKTFDHATNWCGYDSVCTLTVGDYDVRLRFFMSGRSYRLRVAPSWDGADPCCTFGMETTRPWSQTANRTTKGSITRQPLAAWSSAHSTSRSKASNSQSRSVQLRPS